jgi:hypothetical protein
MRGTRDSDRGSDRGLDRAPALVASMRLRVSDRAAAGEAGWRDARCMTRNRLGIDSESTRNRDRWECIGQSGCAHRLCAQRKAARRPRFRPLFQYKLEHCAVSPASLRSDRSESCGQPGHGAESELAVTRPTV